MIDPQRLLDAYHRARADLLARRTADGHWVGELSSSALATATAISALAVAGSRSHGGRAAGDDQQVPPAAPGPGQAPAPSPETAAGGAGFEACDSRLIVAGLRWLARAQNADGGWGDTDRSLSNIATTMLVRAAFRLTGLPADRAGLWERSQLYVQQHGGVAGVRRRYGKDKTFAVPILANAALAGLVPWRSVPALPFELACLPQSAYRFLRLPVVSYAIPALVAIGQARHFHRKPLNPLARGVRRAAARRSLQVVERMQPASGGFLEATPLTSLVVMSLASAGHADHPVVARGLGFLRASARPDGSWPIDTNLATWNTTLAINALTSAEGTAVAEASPGDAADVSRLPLRDDDPLADPRLLDWLLSCQHVEAHRYTGARPGGWGWSDVSGAVPDADDTAGALLALARLIPRASPRGGERIVAAARAGVTWLLDLQNADGGWPTFCRGWGKLPFDRSGTDLTAHALRALGAWGPVLRARGATRGFDRELARRGEAASQRGFAYLAGAQAADGGWRPLWFGNQHHPAEENPVYGTSRVLLAYSGAGRMECGPARRGVAWLVGSQNADGGWGGGVPEGGTAPRSSTEETALAAEALLADPVSDPRRSAAVGAGLDWLVRGVEANCYAECSPIGLYFAKLWYHERLYPLIFTVSALGRAAAQRGLCRLPTPELAGMGA
jgi:squalene-hopene/tetraprenyl-beta-curcumene cyclase